MRCAAEGCGGGAAHRAERGFRGWLDGVAAASGRIPTLPILLLTISSKLLFAYKIIPAHLVTPEWKYTYCMVVRRPCHGKYVAEQPSARPGRGSTEEGKGGEREEAGSDTLRENCVTRSSIFRATCPTETPTWTLRCEALFETGFDRTTNHFRTSFRDSYG